MARRPPRPDDLWLLNHATDARWSPAGDLIAFTVTTHDRDTDKSEPSVWVTAPGEAARVFARRPAHSPRFSPDGTRLALLADRGDGVQVFLADLDGGEPHAITEQANGVTALAWSPDGGKLAFVSRTGEAHDPNQPRVVRHLRHRLDGFGWLDDRRSHIFVHDLGTGATVQVTDGDWDDDQPSWSPDGRSIVFVSDRAGARFDRPFRRDVWVTPSIGGAARRLTRGRGDAMEPQVSPDGATVAYLGGEHGDALWSAPTDVLTVPLAGKDHAPVSLTARHDVHAGSRFLVSCRQLAWDRSGESLVFCGPRQGGLALWSISADGRQLTERVAGDRAVLGFDLGPDGRLAFPSLWVDEPSEIWIDGPDGTSRVTDLNARLRSTVTLAKAKRIRSKAADGTVTESFLVKPAKAGAAPSLVLDVHGGPHAWHPGTSAGGWLAVQALAGAGHHVLLPNPRGSAGYGAEFLRACVGDWGGGDADDLLAAVDRAEALVKPARTAVWGYSFGGFMTSWLIGHTDRFSAAVVGAPVIDLVSMLGTTDIPGFTVHSAGGLPWEAADAYAKRSPLTYAPDIRTPVLLLHHEGDLRCPVGQSEQLFTALRLLGREVELVRYPGGFHGVARPSLVVDRTERVVAWLEPRS